MRSVLSNNPFFGPATSYSAATLDPVFDELEGYDNRVAMASMFPYIQNRGTSVLDVCCGPVTELPLTLIEKGCEYHGIDIESYYLAQLDIEIYNKFPKATYETYCCDVVSGMDAFDDNSFDVVLVKCALMHLPSENWTEIIQQMYRLAKRALFIQDMSWTRLGSAKERKLFDNYRAASAKLFEHHKKQPEMDLKMPAVITRALPGVPLEMFRIDDRPEGDHRDALLPVCQGGLRCLRGCYTGKEYKFIDSVLQEMERYLSGDDVSFVPPAALVAHIPKTTKS